MVDATTRCATGIVALDSAMPTAISSVFTHLQRIAFVVSASTARSASKSQESTRNKSASLTIFSPLFINQLYSIGDTYFLLSKRSALQDVCLQPNGSFSLMEKVSIVISRTESFNGADIITG